MFEHCIDLLKPPTHPHNTHTQFMVRSVLTTAVVFTNEQTFTLNPETQETLTTSSLSLHIAQIWIPIILSHDIQNTNKFRKQSLVWSEENKFHQCMQKRSTGTLKTQKPTITQSPVRGFYPWDPPADTTSWFPDQDFWTSEIYTSSLTAIKPKTWLWIIYVYVKQRKPRNLKNMYTKPSFMQLYLFFL